MNVSFVDPKLSDLYKGITVKERRYRYPPELIKQYIKTVKKLESVDKVEELFQFHSLNYEKLKGQQKDFSSVRINKKLHLLFHEVLSEEEPFEVNRLTITEISNFKS
jgi:toxin HigB-1